MAQFRDRKIRQQCAAVDASIHNRCNHPRHLTRRDMFKPGQAATVAEWRQLAA